MYLFKNGFKFKEAGIFEGDLIEGCSF